MSFQGLAGLGQARRAGRLPPSLPGRCPPHSPLPLPQRLTRSPCLLAGAMATFNLSLLPPNPEEKDFIQAYEDVREKYKGTPPGPTWQLGQRAVLPHACLGARARLCCLCP